MLSLGSGTILPPTVVGVVFGSRYGCLDHRVCDALDAVNVFSIGRPPLDQGLGLSDDQHAEVHVIVDVREQQ